MKRYSIAVDETEHAEIAHWLEQQKNVSGAVRALIAQHLAGNAEQPTAQLDLSAIRAVMDAALDEKLRGLSIGTPERAGQDDELYIFNDLLE